MAKDPEKYPDLRLFDATALPAFDARTGFSSSGARPPFDVVALADADLDLHRLSAIAGELSLADRQAYGGVEDLLLTGPRQDRISAAFKTVIKQLMAGNKMLGVLSEEMHARQVGNAPLSVPNIDFLVADVRAVTGRLQTAEDAYVTNAIDGVSSEGLWLVGGGLRSRPDGDGIVALSMANLLGVALHGGERPWAVVRGRYGGPAKLRVPLGGSLYIARPAEFDGETEE
ncbi:MAG TPA: hypothetical protein VLF40_04520 [Candidatus Saccharimonadales bacterium]|nr:hypothetical protein [Candidatus Saccharimonadales bacterium]